MLYSGCKRLADKAKDDGIDVTFETWDDVPHGFHVFGLNVLPEAEDAINHIKYFIQKLFTEQEEIEEPRHLPTQGPLEQIAVSLCSSEEQEPRGKEDQ